MALSENKICSICKTEKILDEFYLYRGKYKAECKECGKIRTNNYRKQHPLLAKQWKRKTYLINKEKYLAYSKQYIKEWMKTDRGRAYLHNNRSKRRTGIESNINEIEINQMYSQQNGHCFYCDKLLFQTYHIDHIIPISKGGENKLYNLVLACPQCNSAKYNISPELFVEYILKEAI